MKAQEWTNTDKSGWPPGPWHDEPDKMQFEDEETGLPCLIVRNNGGALCGYVGVDETHPWHGIDYSGCTLPEATPRGHRESPHYGDDYTSFEKHRATVTVCDKEWCGHSPESQIEVHGGLTFSNACAETSDPSKHICHVPDKGEPDNVWWFGFDCAHLGDRSPGYERKYPTWPRDFDESYKDTAYVKREIKWLAKQLASVAAND